MKRAIIALLIAITITMIGAPVTNAQDAVCVDPDGWVVACSQEYKVLQPKMEGPNLWSVTIVVNRKTPLMSTRDQVATVYGRTCDEAQDRARQFLRIIKNAKEFMSER